VALAEGGWRPAALLLGLGALAVAVNGAVDWHLARSRPGEAQFQGRPARSWAEELARWMRRAAPQPGAGAGPAAPAPGAEALFQGDPEAVPVLTELLAWPDPVDRQLAAFALERVGPRARKAASPALLAQLKDPDPNVRAAARSALAKVNPAALQAYDAAHPRGGRDGLPGAKPQRPRRLHLIRDGGQAAIPLLPPSAPGRGAVLTPPAYLPGQGAAGAAPEFP
jgi:hypothetical protein